MSTHGATAFPAGESHAGLRRGGRVRYLAALLVPLTLAAAYLLTQQRIRLAERLLHHHLLEETQQLARTVNIQRVRAFQFTVEDRHLPEFQRLRSQITAYLPLIPYGRNISLLGMREGRIVAGPDTDPHPQLPGRPLPNAPEYLNDLFEKGGASITKTTSEEPGADIRHVASAIRDPLSGLVRAVLIVEVDAADWTARLHRQRYRSFLRLSVPALILLLGLLLCATRNREEQRLCHLVRHAEVYTLFAFGLAISLNVALEIHHHQRTHRWTLFRQRAAEQASRITQTIHTLRDAHVYALASFFRASDHVREDEFAEFTLLRVNLFDAHE